MTGSEQLVRILLALAFIGFSSQEHTTLIQAMAGYVVGGILLTSALFAQCASWKLLEENSPLVPPSARPSKRLRDT
jgi:hypothetical protein